MVKFRSFLEIRKNFKRLKYEHEARDPDFSVCNYFREKFKFRGFMNAFMIFAKYIIVHKIVKFIYFAKQIIYLKFPGQVL